MQKQLIFIGVIAVAIAAIWSYRTGNEQTEDAVSTAPPPADEQARSVNTGETGTVVSEGVVTEGVEDASSSPFAVIPDAAPGDEAEESTPLNNVAENNTAEVINDNSVTITGESQVSDDSTTAEPLPGIVVPSSYPASDAAKYFIPADQRRPGNLGGPPPLPFADSGTGDATLPEGGGLTPPPPPPTQ